MIKVRMSPHLDDLKKGESGIHEVVRKWFKHLPDYGIDLVAKNIDSFDVLAIHAGMGTRYPNDIPIVSHLHGLYWTADYSALAWEWVANSDVIMSMRRADAITVPSNWVAESVQRDMRINPTVIPHGIDWDEWQGDYTHDDYILAYGKNRVMDVCNPMFINELARRFPEKLFICTFAPRDAPPNVRVTGLLPHEKMKQIVQRASVVISPVKETFGLLYLESMASGTPVLGYNYGGNRDLIKHGISGYLAQPNNIDDLSEGLRYCLQYRNILGSNSREIAKGYTWDIACRKLAEVYKSATEVMNNYVSVVIPVYNYSDVIGRAIDSVLDQTFLPMEIIVVDDGSDDSDKTKEIVESYYSKATSVRYHRQNNSGVAVARNTGISMAIGEYIICMDADDRMSPEFIRACKEALDKNVMLGIAYTGLMTVTPDGKESVSPWPPAFDFDDMVYYGGLNQIPTCCMFRKEIWRRLGGYRSRYCPHGAGSEDAEFWLRAGLYGFQAEKVTDAPLFLYSYQSGRVSGDKSYREIDWRSLHPSTKDHLHPFACVATPMNSRPSHPVRQYDEPVVSVVVPVGNGHKQHVVNVLDSLESQTFRKWEVILVDDTTDDSQWTFDGVPDILISYPYVKLISSGGKGAGYARNRGAEKARAPLLIFMDADDNFLVPDALEKMVDTWNETGMAVYTDYISKAIISPEEAQKHQKTGRLLDYDQKSRLAMYKSFAEDYDCERAIIQPANPLYLWNLITTLIPKVWHDEIGGFDESMPSWEDWEYWLRMARRGKCFARLEEPMVAYRFYTGGRRETGIQMPQELLSYITKKLEGVEIMPCRSCGGNKKSVTINIPIQTQSKPSNLSDSDMVLITYMNPNRGGHKVVGPTTKINYGYRFGGGAEKFYVHKEDAAVYPDWFVPYTPQTIVVESQPVVPPAPPIEIETAQIPDFIDTSPASQSLGMGQSPFKPADLQGLPGVTDKIAEEMAQKGVKTWEDVIGLGLEGLMSINGVGEKRATAILSAAKKNAGL